MVSNFDDDQCHGKHLGHEVEMPYSCSIFTPISKYIKFSWHSGEGQLYIFSDSNCTSGKKKITQDRGNEWKCMSLIELGGMNSMMVPDPDHVW